jgi:hypothetical protein
VWVDSPVIDGDHVYFAWRQTAENPYQRANEFYFRYEGIDLASFSSSLLFEIFLSLQLKIFKQYRFPISLTFPEALPSRSVEFWKAFHGADEIEIGPISDIEGYEPIASPLPHPTRKAAIFYGGGKDSMLATGLLSEILGDDQVVLVQYVAPITPTAGAMAMHERRQQRYMLDPVRKLRGVATQRVFTNYLANLTETGIKFRPHRQFFTAGALPALLAWRTEYSTFGDTRTDFPVFMLENGKRHYTFSGSRPEILAAQSMHYQEALGFNHQLTNVNFAFSTSQNQVLLTRRYPELLPATVSCTTGNSRERFCHRCYKCMIWAIFGLAAGHVDPDVDYDRLLTQNEWMMNLVNYADTGVDLSFHGNAIWVDGLMKYPISYQPICHSLASLDPDLLKGRVGLKARANLYTMLALFGNTRFENQEVVAKEIFDFTGIDLMYRVAKLASEHHPMVAKLPGPWIVGRREAIIDYQTRMPTRLDDVPHIHAARNPA